MQLPVKPHGTILCATSYQSSILPFIVAIFKQMRLV